MATDEVRIRRALIGVADKQGLNDLAAALQHHQAEIISTGGTRSGPERSGVQCHRGRAFHRFPRNSRWARENAASQDSRRHPRAPLRRRRIGGRWNAIEIEPIDLVVVNFYPFEQTVARPGVTLDEAIENIDIGGPAMVRAAAKNYADVAVVVDPADYADLIAELARHDGALTAATRWRLARKAFARVAAYDAAIANYLGRRAGDGNTDPLGESFSLSLPRTAPLRYGENPHQAGAIYGGFNRIAEQLHGRELSFNNVFDISSAINLMIEFQDVQRAGRGDPQA